MKTVFFLLILIGGVLLIPEKSLAQNAGASSEVQERPFKNSVYLEAGGNGLAGSLNYERLLFFPSSPASNVVALRVGIFYVPLKGREGESEYAMAIPAEANIFWGRRAIKPEIGFGLTYFERYDGQDSYSEEGYTYTDVLPVFRFGVRYAKPGKHLSWRLGFTPMVIGFLEDYSDSSSPFMPWGGVSVGYSFGR